MKRKTIDFMEARAERNGEVTPYAVAESVFRYMQNESNPKIKRIAIVVLDEDGSINTACSTMDYLELMGLHVAAQSLAYEEME